MMQSQTGSIGDPIRKLFFKSSLKYNRKQILVETVLTSIGYIDIVINDGNSPRFFSKGFLCSTDCRTRFAVPLTITPSSETQQIHVHQDMHLHNISSYVYLAMKMKIQTKGYHYIQGIDDALPPSR